MASEAANERKPIVPWDRSFGQMVSVAAVVEIGLSLLDNLGEQRYFLS
jgi:hypothetical protein